MSLKTKSQKHLSIRFPHIFMTVLLIIVGWAILKPNHIAAQQETYSPQAQALYDLFSGENCALNCFMGLRPGITTKQEFIDFLKTSAIEYNQNSSDFFINWSFDYPLFNADHRIYLTTRQSYQNDKIESIFGNLQIPLETLTEVFGSPIVTLQNIDQYPVNDASRVYLLYPDLGLGFKVSANNPLQTSSFDLAFPRSFWSWTNDNLDSTVQIQHQHCPDYNTPPCILPTATPTVSPQGFTLTDEDIIRTVFSGENCALNCFLGISPSITTDKEFWDWLDDIPTEGHENAVYWISPNTQTPKLGRILYSTIRDGYVQSVSGRIEIPYEMILEIFGTPSSVTYKYYLSGDKVIKHVTYTHYGLIFELWQSLNGTFYSIGFTLSAPPSQNNSQRRMDDTLYQEYCPQHEIWPCVIPLPTATPYAG